MKNNIRKRQSKLTIYLKLSFFFFLIVNIIVGVMYIKSDDDFFLLFIGFLLHALFTIAIISRRNISVIEPISLMLFAIMAGVIIKIPYLVANPEVMERLLIGQDKSIFVYGSLYILVGFISYIFGLLLVKNKTISSNTNIQEQWLKQKMISLLLFIFTVSFIASILLIKEISLSNLLESFSAKRFQELDDRSSRLSSNLYIYYKISLLSRIPLYISFIYLLSNNKKKTLITKICKTMFLLSLLITLLTPTIFNNRAAAALSIVDLIFIAIFLGVKIKAKYYVMSTILLVIPFAYATAKRSVINSNINYNIFSSILDYRYFLDLTKTSHIINYFSTTGEKLYGETLVGWLFIPIPTSIIEEQPRFMEIGLFLGQEVFKINSLVSGVPAGYIAELFMNFGLIGIVLGMFFIGYIMQRLYNLHLRNKKDTLISVLVAMISLRFLVFLFNNDLGTFLLKNLLETFPTIFILFLLLKKRKHTPFPKFTAK